MDLTLTLVAPQSQQILDADAIAQISTALTDAEVYVRSNTELVPNLAHRITLSATDQTDVSNNVRKLIGSRPIDFAVLPERDQKARLLIADMDSTIIQCECLDELADLAGFGPQVSAITERAMRGELDFEGALRERVKMLEGLPEDTLEQTYRERIKSMPGAKVLVHTMRQNGAVTALVSGGFTYFTSRVADDVGFEMNFGNTLEIANGKLTGNVADPILGREAKLATLERLCTEHHIDFQDVIAVGDGANDLAMLQRAGTGVSFRGKPIVEEGADVAVKTTDLTTLLYLQGYSAADIVNPANQ